MHTSAIVDSRAELDSSVEIGPGAVIGPGVRIGADSIVGPNAAIVGNTTIGRRNRIWQFAALGAEPQDLKFKDEPSRVEIGDDNLIREFVTIHRGTEGGGMVTRVGSNILLMTSVHVAHDCTIGDHAIIATGTGLAGHCAIEEYVTVEGMVGLHQFCRVGAHAIVAAGSKVAQDVPPYSMVAGPERARLAGINGIGLKRRGFPAETIAALKSAVRTIFFGKLLRADALRKAREEHGDVPEVRRLIDFIANSKRGVTSRQHLAGC
ncbi:MAG: acyl-ACP--UDP-N-acetylglucosamine O-acyltransferase [Candidatus Binataceae bacterium]